MSQAASYGVSESGPQTPTAHAQENNDTLDAILSQHSGTSRPAYVVASSVWVDVVSGTEENAYYFDGTDDILIYTINPTANTIVFSDLVIGTDVLAPDGDGSALTGIDATNLSAITAFTAGGTWTKPANFSHALVYVTGSGGGGGGSSNSSNRAGGGGGAGGTAIERLTDGELSATEAVTIGAAGTAGTATGNGGAGGTCSFGALCSATGGDGGLVGGVSHDGVDGGVGSGGDINLTGGGGGEGSNGATGSTFGGASYWGGGAAGAGADTVGHAGAAYGSGGGGGHTSDGTGEAGGAGAAGYVVVFEYTTG